MCLCVHACVYVSCSSVCMCLCACDVLHAQVKKQLLQTKEDMEANLEAKEEELSRMSASYSKVSRCPD